MLGGGFMRIGDQLRLLAGHPDVRHRRARYFESVKDARENNIPIWITKYGWFITDKAEIKDGNLLIWDKKPINLGLWTDGNERYSLLEDISYGEFRTFQ